MNHKKSLFVLSTALLCGTFLASSLASCGGSNESSESSSLTSEEKEPAKVETKLAEGTEITFEGDSDTFAPGSQVAFRVNLLHERYALEAVLVDGKEVQSDEQGLYTFVMADRDVSIETKSIVLGEEGLNEVTPFTKDTLPAVKSIAELKEVLEKANVESGKFFKEATFKTSTTSSSPTSNSYDYKIVAGYNNILNVDGSYLDYYNLDANIPVHEQYRIENDRLIERKAKVNLGDVTESMRISKIGDVAMGADISEDDAKAKVTGFDYYTPLKETYLDSYSFDWSQAQFKNSVDAETKSIATVVATIESYDSWSEKASLTTLTVSYDGDYFLREASVTHNIYASSDYTEGSGIAEGATPVEENLFSYKAIRGYKHVLQAVNNASDYVMNDYDVLVEANIDGKKQTFVNGGEIPGNSILSFRFRCRDLDNFLVLPSFVGFREEEGFFDGESKEIVKLGTYHLLFDNGLGEIKEIEVTATEPKASSISVKASSNQAFLDTPVEVNVKITPSLAKQEVTLVAAETSKACTIEGGENGLFLVTGKELGTVKLIASSKANPEIQSEVSIEVISKPTYESITTLLRTKTFREAGVSYGDPFQVNFNEDGTGVLARQEYDYNYYDYVTKYSYFNYTLDQETLAFSITSKTGGELDYFVVGIPLATDTSFTIEIDYGYTVKALSFDPIDRISL